MKIHLTILIIVLLSMTTTAGAWESSLADPSVDNNGDQRFDGEHLSLTSQAFTAADAFTFLSDPPGTSNEVCGTVQDFNTPAEYYDKYGTLMTRTFCPAQFSELPDFSHSMEDYINQNKNCPPYLNWDAKECHSFLHFMGALNSNHFPPQLKTNYTQYHNIAQAVLYLSNDLYDKLSDAGALSEYRSYYEECRAEALTYESIAQHYLQDQWSMGHMWHRWGGPEVDDFPTTGNVNVLGKLILGGIAHGTVVGAVSGLIHGWKSTVENIWGMQPSAKDDAMCYYEPEVDWLSYDPVILSPGWGDMYLENLLNSSDQKQILDGCMAESLSQLTPFRQNPGELAPICWGNLATNLAMHIGLNLSPSVAANYALEVLGQCGPPRYECEVKIQEASRELMKLSTIFRLAADKDPYDTYLAEGYTSKSRDTRLDLFSIKPNDEYNRTSSYIDPARYAPGDPADTGGVQPDNRLFFGVRQIRYFNMCHAELYCDDPSIVNDYRQGCRSTSNPSQGLDCQICEELAARFFVGEPPLCEILAPGTSPDPNNQNPPKTSQEVKTWCRSASPKTYWGEIILSKYAYTYYSWYYGSERTSEDGFMWWEGPLSYYKQGEYDVYSGNWNEGYPGTSYGGNMMVVIDPDTNSVIEFNAQNIETWDDCGPNIIGHDDRINGPKKPGAKIPFMSWGDYYVSGIKVCTDYVPSGNIWWIWGCPGFADEYISHSCNDSTELKLRIREK